MANNTVMMMAARMLSGDCACPLPSIMWPAQIQVPEAAPYVGCVCCFILAIVLRGFTMGIPVKPSPQKAGVCGRAVNTTNSGVWGWSLARRIVFLDNKVYSTLSLFTQGRVVQSWVKITQG